jgi:2,3-bisphosphoglycerate-dependent phosphoglycerate mutase
MTTSPGLSEGASTGPDRIVFARHGHAICNRDRTIHGPTCPGLTETGTRQAHALAEKLAGTDITAVHASTTRRSLDTARILAEKLALPVRDEPDLRVPDPGAAEGLHWDDARSRWPLDPIYPTRPLPDDAEPWTTYLDRACRTLDRIATTSPGTPLVVGHSETLTAWYSHLIGVQSLGTFRVGFPHCTTSTWHTPAHDPGRMVTRWQTM